MYDFGFKDELPLNKPQSLPREMQLLPAFSTPCELAGIQPAGDVRKWSKTAIEWLNNFLDGKKMFLALEEGGNTPHL